MALSSQALNVSKDEDCTLWIHVPVFDHLHGEKSFSLYQTGISLQLVLLSQGKTPDTLCSSRSGWQLPFTGVLPWLRFPICQVTPARAADHAPRHAHTITGQF